MKNIYKSWRTTIIGLFLLLISAAYLLLNMAPDYIILSILLTGGISLLFFPDDILIKLKSFLSKKSKSI